METKMKKAQLEAELKKAQKRISMLEAKASTQNNDDRYYSLFEESPFSLWEEDFSEVKIKLDQLKEGGVTDLRGLVLSGRGAARSQRSGEGQRSAGVSSSIAAVAILCSSDAAARSAPALSWFPRAMFHDHQRYFCAVS